MVYINMCFIGLGFVDVEVSIGGESSTCNEGAPKLEAKENSRTHGLHCRYQSVKGIKEY